MGFRDLSLRTTYRGQAGQLAREFYVPVMREATRYDRQAGYFDSTSLVWAAEGLASFAGRAARIRMITNTVWRPDDLEAFNRGHAALSQSVGQNLRVSFIPSPEECERLGLPSGWRPEADSIAGHRLGTLAWLVARGILEMKVALPLDEQGRPIEPGPRGGIYHSKVGVLGDAAGDMIAFSGSINETGAAWARNREEFDVFFSWRPGDAERVREKAQAFELMWNSNRPGYPREAGLLILDLPEAARQELLKFEPAEPPTHDIFDPPTDRRIQRAKAQFLLDAPRLAGSRQLVLDPLTLQPYPHQYNVARRASQTYPHPYLFCDEVGLGKTIEAGLALRALLLSGAVRRVLLLTPKALVRQWQEELREKFALTAWFCDGKTLVDVGGRVRELGAPWDESEIIAASHQLVARRARQDEILGASPWDLAIVDEGHRARRRAMDDPSPNLLLSLLRRMQAQGKITCLWLLTATPMQLDPCEVHDLLRLCGVDHRWADWEGEDGFRRYFDDLQRFAVKADVRRHVLRMADIARAHGAEALRPDAPPEDWDGARWRHLVQLIQRRADAVALAMTRLTSAEASSLARRLVRQTPLGVFMFRHTRATLRRYVAEGLLQAPVPTRDPEDRVVTFTNPAEEELYRRIDRYCEEFYRALDPDVRGGMGFLVAVYRKRLTSSFTALIKSLERRIALLDIARETMAPTGEVRVLAETGAEVDEDESAEDPDREEPPDRPEPRSWVARAELDRLRGLPPGAIEKERAFLVEYVRDLHRVVSSGEESKLQVFREELARLVDQGHRILVFTMYRDTMDFLRDRLVPTFSGRMACYSGRGGEIYDVGRGWVQAEKAEIKRRAAPDHRRSLQLLLCTDAASEGVNLQHFSAIINYDLPWNPMRVEQRIGRIDRIGQQAPKVRIVNLYIQDTIENDAYHVLIRRIGFFRQVVGPLQPILAAIPRLIRAVSIEGEDRAAALRRLEAAAAEEVGSSIPELNECALGDGGPGREEAATAPLTQRELADWLPHRRPSGLRLIPFTPETSVRTPSFPDCTFILTWPGAPASLGIRDGDEVRVTLDPAIADAFPPTAPSADEGVEREHREGIRLLTWGDPLLEAWLEALRGKPLTNDDWAALGLSRRATSTSIEYTCARTAAGGVSIAAWQRFCEVLGATGTPDRPA